VTVKQFAMSVTEVTRDQFDAFVSATGYQASGACLPLKRARDHVDKTAASYDWRDPGFNQGGNHPVVCVNWNDAKAYVHWLSQKTGKEYRLPTEAEWEYAARAGTTTPRYWGLDNSSACRNANVADQTYALAYPLDTKTSIFQCTDGHEYTAPVAQFQANAFGLNDMLGNVWEWTEDCSNTSYNGAPTNGSAWLTGACSDRVNRGESWYHYPGLVRAADRNWDSTTYRSNNLGFRVSRTN
jgi:formylglycine-generating enzyme required for sulfatase activity